MHTRLGQHFLVSPRIAERIVAAAAIAKADTVLEVGPGRGVLTALLLQKTGAVVAVEKDAALVQLLQEKFVGAKNLTLLQGDILSPLNISEIQSPKIMGKYVVVANLPYYITSRFLRIFLEGPAPRPKRMVLMVQKEVAERIVARPPAMNLLALSVQAFGKPKILFTVSKNNFSPPPKVDSAVIAIADISDTFFKTHHVSPNDFFALAKKAFGQKRKMLRSSLKANVSEIQSPKFRRLDLRILEKRPQELGLEEWVGLTRSRTSTTVKDSTERPKSR